MKIPLEMSGFKEVKNILFTICIFLSIFIPIMGILSWQPATYHELVIGNIKLYDYLTFASTRAPNLKWFELLAGGGAFEAGFIASILFFVNNESELDIIHQEIGFKNIEFKKSFANQALIIKAEKNN